MAKLKNEKFRTLTLDCKKVEEKRTRKDDGDNEYWEKATFKDLSQKQIVTLKMSKIPDELAEGSKAVLIFVDEQQKLDEE